MWFGRVRAISQTNWVAESFISRGFRLVLSTVYPKPISHYKAFGLSYQNIYDKFYGRLCVSTRNEGNKRTSKTKIKKLLWKSTGLRSSFHYPNSVGSGEEAKSHLRKIKRHKYTFKISRAEILRYIISNMSQYLK